MTSEASEFKLLINGTLRDGAESADVLNPATGESIGKVTYASTADLDEALGVASRGLAE